MEAFMVRLSNLVLGEIGRRGCSVGCFAELCGLSRNEVSRITNRSKKDINVSTVLKICENSNISLFDVFGVNSFDKEMEKELSKFYLTNGSVKYYIKKF